MTENVRDDLMDDDGENRAVRSLLLAYGGNPSMTVGRMRDHMDMSGWENLWPEWVSESPANAHLTKSGAQDWIRYLFSLEEKVQEPISTVNNDDVRDANRWRAFVRCARIRFFGWAGVDNKDENDKTRDYVHFGAEFWTMHDAGTSPDAARVLTTFADAAVRLENKNNSKV